ncbi:MAG: HAMP domain-containing histidine kinase [Nannocystaceae bacterium]|nr:HAMP domain-containing histidine kinase [Nannocystaceae bacterium]
MRRGPRWSLAWWLLLSHLAVGAGAVVALLLTGVLDRDLRWQTLNALEAQAHVWSLSIGRQVSTQDRPLSEVAQDLRPDLAQARRRTLVGLQIVDLNANVVASGGAANDTWLGDAAEVRTALSGEIGRSSRPRPSLQPRQDLPLDGPSRFGDVRLFVAVPIVVDDAIVGAVVVSRTPRAQVQALVQIGSPLLWRLLAIAGFAAVVAFTAGHFGSRSFRRLARAARSIAGGTSHPFEWRKLRRSRVSEVAAVAGVVETMGRRLRHRMDGAEAFAGNAAHEFRTPIATLRGTLELMRDDAAMPAEQRERFLANGIAELHRLDALVGGLLDLGRAERLPADETVDLDAILVHLTTPNGVPVDGSAGFVLGNRAALETVVGNLVDNARQHGGAHVEVHAWHNPTQAGFDVIDDGPGIDAASEARLFERFFTTDRSQGVGLGLAVVRGLVHAHGGEIHAHCEPGRTRFSVTLRREETPLAKHGREHLVVESNE